MKLIDNWQAVLKGSWAIRLSMLVSILSGAELLLQQFAPAYSGSAVFVAVAGIVSTCAAVARLVLQKKLHEDDNA